MNKTPFCKLVLVRCGRSGWRPAAAGRPWENRRASLLQAVPWARRRGTRSEALRTRRVSVSAHSQVTSLDRRYPRTPGSSEPSEKPEHGSSHGVSPRQPDGTWSLALGPGLTHDPSRSCSSGRSWYSAQRPLGASLGQAARGGGLRTSSETARTAPPIGGLWVAGDLACVPEPRQQSEVLLEDAVGGAHLLQRRSAARARRRCWWGVPSPAARPLLPVFRTARGVRGNRLGSGCVPCTLPSSAGNRITASLG